jgi:hypothetical protein
VIVVTGGGRRAGVEAGIGRVSRGCKFLFPKSEGAINTFRKVYEKPEGKTHLLKKFVRNIPDIRNQ